jgi:hypothetical protein
MSEEINTYDWKKTAQKAIVPVLAGLLVSLGEYLSTGSITPTGAITAALAGGYQALMNFLKHKDD